MATGETSASVRRLRYVAALAVGAAVPIFLFSLPWLVHANGIYETGSSVVLGAFALGYAQVARRLGVAITPSFAQLVAVFGLTLAIVSTVTGLENGLTDEPYTTPRYLGLLLGGHDPYAYALTFDYVQYGSTYHSTSFYVYLPLLQFLYVPGVDYRWVCIAAWGATLYILRGNDESVVLWAQPYVALIAASGYNDLLVLLFLTWSWVGLGGRRRRWAEILALGLKQFATVIAVAYHLFRREWRSAGVAVAVTVAWLVPFLVWDPLPTLCNSLAYGVPAACAPYSNHDMPGWNWNYSIYLVWVLAAFHRPLAERWRRLNANWVGPWRATRWGRWTEGFARYAFVGATGVVVNLVVFSLVGRIAGPGSFWVLVASAAAFVVAMLWNFFWNYRWTFAGLGGRTLPFHLSVYAAIQVVALAVNLVVLDVLLAVGISPLPGQVVGILLASLWGFGANLRWNFRGSGTAPREGERPPARPGR